MTSGPAERETIEGRRDPHWIPQVVIVAGLGLVALAWGVDAFGLSAPGMGRAQLGLLAGSALVVGLGAVLQVAHRRGVVTLPDWSLPEDPPAGAFSVLLAVWFGLLAGILDPALLHLQNLIGLRFLYINPHMSWMSPISYSVFFAAAVGLFWIVGRGHWRWLRSTRATAAWLTLLAVTSLLLLFHPELQVAATLLLAAGVATQVFRMLSGRVPSFRKLVSRSVAPLVGCCALIAGYELGVPALREARALAALPAAQSGAPNVLLIILDAVRGANVTFDGYARATTPHLARRADDGVVFEEGIATASWSAPSHASLMTGRYPFELTVDWLSPLSDRYPTLAETLAANGYRTGGFSANKRYTGTQTGLNRGASHWDVDRVSVAAVLGASVPGRMIIEPKRLGMKLANENPLTQKDAPVVSGEILDWVEGGPNRPFFAMMNYFDAHGPYDDAPPPFDTMFSASDRPPLPVNPKFDKAAIMRGYDGYDRSITYLDSELEQLFSRLDELGQLDRTIVIVTADHGEEFGEKDVLTHGNSLDYTVLHVPLVMWGPGVPHGLRVQGPVSLRDIPATIVDLVDAERGPRLPGVSLARFWSDSLKDEVAPPVFAAAAGRSWLPEAGERRFGNMLAAFLGRLRYGRYGVEADEELFDIVADPWEQKNLANLPRYAGVIARFRKLTDPIAADYMRRELTGLKR